VENINLEIDTMMILWGIRSRGRARERDRSIPKEIDA